MSNDDLYSVCATRTLLKLSCMNCVSLKECTRFKSRHNGVTPYEYSKQLANESEVKENEKS